MRQIKIVQMKIPFATMEKRNKKLAVMPTELVVRDASTHLHQVFPTMVVLAMNPAASWRMVTMHLWAKSVQCAVQRLDAPPAHATSPIPPFILLSTTSSELMHAPKKGQFYMDDIPRFILGLPPVNTGPAYGCAAATAPVLDMKPFGISLRNKDVLA